MESVAARASLGAATPNMAIQDVKNIAVPSFIAEAV
jgi:hypothetical protein